MKIISSRGITDISGGRLFCKRNDIKSKATFPFVGN